MFYLYFLTRSSFRRVPWLSEGMSIDVVNNNYIEFNMWVVDVYESSDAHVSYVFSHKELVHNGPWVVHCVLGHAHRRCLREPEQIQQTT